jgi:hypothetical protein
MMVVPLSDAERLREAIENHKRRILAGPKDKKYPEDYEEEADEQLWAALDREGVEPGRVENIVPGYPVDREGEQDPIIASGKGFTREDLARGTYIPDPGG